MAINLPVRVIWYTPLQDSVKCREELTTYGYDDVHFSFASLHPSLEIGSISGHGSDSNYREHPNNPADILVTSMTHPGVFQPVVTGLEALRTPAEMGQLFQGSKAVDILSFRDEGSQGRDVTYGKSVQAYRATCGKAQLSPSPLFQ
jgi:hypothetical protein